ncbi:Glycerophosphoryl diester phosphodiesterase [Paracholeplasma brassicae]|uniref:Glycerophosphoryl diester phosphodiesterase n=1 Tax=Acholeplasma brassicae TaxID=61635 RepID=U4KSS7_9MOLU|nr:glycerophosphodiester phosphodiesterase family protein [Paracholeplasma brassicae]CCV65459.1 Glycerophosphoryl diester phosphodiesterase [Paracholeplasma brassicae]
MKDLSFLKNYHICHRGLHDENNNIIENTLTSFDKALEKNYAIELDTNILSCGTVVVFHDRNLKRLVGREDILKDITYEELKDVVIKGTNETIHTLEYVLNYINGRVPLLIELKPFGDKKRHVKEVIRLLSKYPHVYAIHSFNPYIVYQFKKLAPWIIRGQITEYFKNDSLNPIAKQLMKRMTFNFLSKPDFITYGIDDLPNKYVNKAKKKNLVILSYVAKTQAQLDFVKSHYDNAVFESFTPN